MPDFHVALPNPALQITGTGMPWNCKNGKIGQPSSRDKESDNKSIVTVCPNSQAY